jgi:hypothetical protein
MVVQENFGAIESFEKTATGVRSTSLRVARRMLRTSVSDDAGVALDFCLIFAP